MCGTVRSNKVPRAKVRDNEVGYSTLLCSTLVCPSVCMYVRAIVTVPRQAYIVPAPPIPMPHAHDTIRYLSTAANRPSEAAVLLGPSTCSFAQGDPWVLHGCHAKMPSVIVARPVSFNMHTTRNGPGPRKVLRTRGVPVPHPSKRRRTTDGQWCPLMTTCHEPAQCSVCGFPFRACWVRS